MTFESEGIIKNHSIVLEFVYQLTSSPLRKTFEFVGFFGDVLTKKVLWYKYTEHFSLIIVSCHCCRFY